MANSQLKDPFGSRGLSPVAPLCAIRLQRNAARRLSRLHSGVTAIFDLREV